MESANDITLCSKQSADVLRAQNEAFLAEYNTDDKQIDYYTNLAMRVFEEFDIDGSFTFDGVRKNVKVWYKNKSGQMQLFRKHPYWSEKHKAIMLLQTETRGIDYYDAGCKYESLLNYVSKTYRPKDRRVLSTFRNGFPWCISNGIEQTATMPGKFATAMDNSCDVPPYMRKVMKEGAKITRIVRHWFSELRLESGEIVDATKLVDDGEPRTRDSFEKRYAVFADAMSELTIEKLTLVSLHFCDFMTMSNGNSWSSCHYINSHNIFHDEYSGSYHGAYKLGCLSYALDKPSFILYTLPSTYDGDEHYRVQKLNRMCCQYEDGVIITGKAYPNNSNDTIQRYRDMMQTIISQCKSVPNLWSCSTDISAVERYVVTASDSAHYPDYMHAKQRPTVSVSRSYDFDLNKRILIGHKAYCLHCGDEIVEASWLQCEKHRIKMVCACCGKKLNEDSAYKKYDGSYYCDDCLFMCEYHKRYEPVSEKNTIETVDGTFTICGEAMQVFARCADCGLYHFKYDSTKTTSGGRLCKKCAKKYAVCYSCNRVIVGGSHGFGTKKVCGGCYSARINGVGVIECDEYNEGDYVLMADDVSCCEYSANEMMETRYPKRVVQITRMVHSDLYLISSLCGHNWHWSKNCFAGKVINANDSMIGKTIDEINSMMKGR